MNIYAIDLKFHCTKVNSPEISNKLFFGRGEAQTRIVLFHISLDCRNINSGLRPQEDGGSWAAPQVLWGGGEWVEVAERGDVPAAPA